MAVLRTTLCAVFMVTVALSKPICLNEGEDSSKSSESSESNSSEETHVEPSQDPLQPETDLPTTIEETDPPATTLLPSADTGTPPAMLQTSALPDPEDPQTSTDPLQLVPDDASQTALGVDISQDMPETDPAQDSMNADSVHALPDPEFSLHPELTNTDIAGGGTNQPQVSTTTNTYQRFPQGATPPFPPHIIKPTPPPFSTAGPPLPIPIGPALTGVPVCFTFQFATPEPDPPRGDSM